jgi:uncharacterized membrane protein YfcA
LDHFLTFLLVGFFAQLADGALGMGFGVISSSILLAQGLPPALVSATVNAAKIPTGTAASISHYLHRNIDWQTARPLALAGVVGGLIGAIMLSGLKGHLLTGLVGLYLLFIGTMIVVRGFAGTAPRVVTSHNIHIIGGTGGLIEGIGGSWGPVVTSALLGSGVEPRHAIGSSAFAELVVSLSVFAVLALTFASGIWGADIHWNQIGMSLAGLVMGGVPAAMIGGYLARYVPKRPLTICVGMLAFSIGVQRLLSLL